MKIAIVTPAPPNSRYGNRVTALRWARILRDLGHPVIIKQRYQGEPLDLLIALHARRSHGSIKRFARVFPQNPMVVALTGTDLYRDLGRSLQAQTSLDLATRIVVLQPKALEELRANWREKARVIYQSADAGGNTAVSLSAHRALPGNLRPARASRTFDVCVIGHLRPVKDPFRTAMASRLLPVSSRIRILHIGAAMTKQEENRACAEMKINRRYRWLGERPAWRVRRILRQSRICVLSSRMEGGANALGEAIVAGTPVLSSRVPGSVGILGEDYPGYFETGDTRELAVLLTRAETDPNFLADLTKRCDNLGELFDPSREREAWVALIDELM